MIFVKKTYQIETVVGKKTDLDLIVPKFQSYHNLINTNKTYPEICVNKYPDHPHLKWSEDMGYCCGSIRDNKESYKNYLIFMINSIVDSAHKTELTNVKPVLNMIRGSINKLKRKDRDEVRQLLNDKEDEIDKIIAKDAEADARGEARWKKLGERDERKQDFGYPTSITRANAVWNDEKSWKGGF